MKYKSDLTKGGKVLKFPGTYKPDPPEEQAKPSDFAMFAFAILGGELDIASKIIGELLTLDDHWARVAATHYSEAYSKDHEIQSEAMQIKGLIRNHQNNDALVSIHRCFGLQGPPAIAALESMRKLL